MEVTGLPQRLGELAHIGANIEHEIHGMCGKHVMQSANARLLRPITMKIQAKAIECPANDMLVVGQEKCLVHFDQ